MKFISLFTGIGGFDTGFEDAGMESVAQVEQNLDCLKLLEQRWPDILRLKDVKDARRDNLPAADLVCGGFPCQDLSVAGRRAGLAGERSGLWFEFHRIIAEVKPRWVVIENVPGLLSSNGGRDFAVILRGLVECGYGVSWRVLDSQYFGVAQRRRRVFIVASLGSGRSAQVLFESEGGAWDSAPRREAGTGVTAVAGTLAANAGGTNRPAGNANEPDFCVTEIGLPLAHLTGKGFWTEGLPGLRANPGGMPENMIAFVQNTRDEVRLMNGDGQIAGALPAQPGMKQQSYIANAFNGYTGGAGDNDAQENHIIAFDWRAGDDSKFHTGANGKHPGGGAKQIVRKGEYSGAINAGRHDAIANHTGVRRLTPTECERLQNFPDGWTAGFSDSVRYRMLGNAVTVSVIRWLGKRILEADDG